MMLLRALVVWLMIIALETLHGIVRQVFIAPNIGDLPARQLGVFTGSLLILAVVWFFYEWLQVVTVKGQLVVGAGWCVLTILFEVSLGLALGLSWQRLLSDYDIRQGGLMLFGMLILVFSLRIVSLIRAKS
ncbi:hypothetical protein KC906_03385 [Candidatus Kaiserbacteria bacterium]|nr:hypothetical protein [Candidatus Kaiserbacteria bacterium]MCP5206386.1 hypothetical protein [Hahellaceae bacterium]MCP5213207.1 hypothetical protein [Hahellaceae bacterium]